MQEFTNTELEQWLLGAVITSPRYIYRMPELCEHHFSTPFYGRVFGETKLYVEQQGDMDLPILFSKFPTPEEKNAIYQVLRVGATVINVKPLADELIKLSRLRVLKNLLLDHANNLTLETDTDQVITAIEEELLKDHEIYQIQKERDVCHNINKDLNETLSCFSTGYDILDVAMGGGLYPSKTYCFAADPKTGKTVILASISHNLSKQGIKHLYIPLEMGSKEIMQRNMAHDINKNAMSFIDQKQRAKPEFLQSVSDYAMQNQGAAFFMDAQGSSFDKIKRVMRTAVKKYNLSGVVIDYLQLITGMGKGENEAQFQGKVAQWIADFCKQEKIWCIYAAQKNREGQLRGSDGIKNAIDQLYMVFKPEEKKDGGKRWMELVASRYTKTMSLGDEAIPAFRIDRSGPYLVENSDKQDDTPQEEGITTYN